MTTTASRLRDLARDVSGRPVPIRDLMAGLGASGTGLFLLLLGLTSLVPGIAPVLGVALCTVALGVALGHDTPYLPGPVGRWTIDGAKLGRGLDRLAPKIAWVERYLTPRAPAFLSGAGRRLAGLAALVNGVLVVLPIPLGNTAPAVATIVLALGLVTRDGLAVAVGIGLTVLATALDIALVGLGAAAVTGLFNAIF